jgi:hypothetical protein
VVTQGGERSMQAGWRFGARVGGAAARRARVSYGRSPSAWKQAGCSGWRWTEHGQAERRRADGRKGAGVRKRLGRAVRLDAEYAGRPCAWERARVSGSERLVAARVQTPGEHIG